MSITTKPTPTLLNPTRLQMIGWALVMLITLFLLVNDWNNYRVGTYGDDGSYVAATESLLSGVNYGTFLDPDNSEAVQFPFFFPLLLAPARAVAPNDLNAMRVVPLVATLGLLTVLFWGWRWIGRGLSYGWGLGTTALTALSPITILHGRTVMSESLFLCICLLLVLVIERVVERPPRAWGIVLGILAIALVYTRTVGWFFLAVGIGYLIWKQRRIMWRQLGIAVATGVIVLGSIMLFTTVRPINLLPQEYIVQLSNLVSGHGIVREMEKYINADPIPGSLAAEPTKQVTGIPYIDVLVFSLVNHFDIADKLPYRYEIAVDDLTTRIQMPFLRYLPLLLAFVIMGIGAWYWVRKTGVTLFQLMAPVYLIVLGLWVWNGSRLLHPIQPQLFLALLLGIYAIGTGTSQRLVRRQTRWVGILTAAFTILVLGAFVWLDLQLARTMLLPGDQIARAAVLQSYMPANARVLSARAETDFLYSPQTYFQISRDQSSPDGLADYLRRNHVQYVVSNAGLTPTEENSHIRIAKMLRLLLFMQPLIQNHVLEVKYFDSSTDLAIYQVNPQRLAELP